MATSPLNTPASGTAQRNEGNSNVEPQSAFYSHSSQAIAAVSNGKALVTQLWYAREGIITPEMEFIAIRENAGRAARSRTNLQSAI